MILGLRGQLTPLGQTYADNLAGKNGDRVEMVLFPGKGIKKSKRLDGRTFLGIHWNKLLFGALVGILDSEPGKLEEWTSLNVFESTSLKRKINFHPKSQINIY